MSHSQPSRLLLPHAKRIPNVVQLDWFAPEEIETVSDSGASASSTRPTDWMLSGDFACFILRTHEISLQKGYLIDAARGDEALARKVISHLKTLGIILDSDFDLEHPSNIISLSPGIRIALDLYGLFAITGNLDTLTDLKSHIKLKNSRWQNNVDMRGSRYSPTPKPYKRYTLNIASCRDPVFQLVVLHPDHMLRDKLWFAGRPEVSLPEGLLFMENGRLKILTEGNAAIDYPPFRHVSGRSLGNSINIYFVLLNAYSKFQHHEASYGFDLLSLEDLQLIALTREIVDELYYVAVPSEGSPGFEIDAKAPPSIARSPAPRYDSASRRRGREFREGGDLRGSAQESMTSSMSPSSSIAGDDDHNDDGRVLTVDSEEMEILEERLSDPALSARERAEAGSMLMFGPRPYATLPQIPGIPTTSSNGLDYIKAEFG